MSCGIAVVAAVLGGTVEFAINMRPGTGATTPLR